MGTILNKLKGENCPVDHADVVKKGNSAVGYVTFANEDMVKEAIITYDNFNWKGKDIRVYKAGMCKNF